MWQHNTVSSINYISLLPSTIFHYYAEIFDDHLFSALAHRTAAQQQQSTIHNCLSYSAVKPVPFMNNNLHGVSTQSVLPTSKHHHHHHHHSNDASKEKK
jgi:hypothetical protein